MISSGFGDCERHSVAASGDDIAGREYTLRLG
jgi:hypothetical protein